MHGLIRRASTFNTGRIDHLYRDPHETDARLFLHYGDLTDGARLVTLLREIEPDEVYNLGAQSHVRVSFDEPEYTGDITGLGTMRLLEAVRMSGIECALLPGVELGDVRRDPAAAERGHAVLPALAVRRAKVYAYWITRNYREAYGMFAVNGILFNHESPRRGETFVTRKITRAVARIKAGLQDHALPRQPRRRARLGLRRRVRRGHVADAAGRRARRLRARDRHGDHGARLRRDRRSRHAGLDWEEHVRFDERYLRPSEVDALIGDAVARPSECSAGSRPSHGRELAQIMVDADIEALEHEGRPWIDQPAWPLADAGRATPVTRARRRQPA